MGQGILRGTAPVDRRGGTIVRKKTKPTRNVTKKATRKVAKKIKKAVKKVVKKAPTRKKTVVKKRAKRPVKKVVKKKIVKAPKQRKEIVPFVPSPSVRPKKINHPVHEWSDNQKIDTVVSAKMSG